MRDEDQLLVVQKTLRGYLGKWETLRVAQEANGWFHQKPDFLRKACAASVPGGCL